MVRSEVPMPDVEESVFYSCPYPPCDFVSDDYDEVVFHIEDAHADKDDFLTPLEIGAVDEEMDEEGRGVYMDYLRQREVKGGGGERKEEQSYINSSLHKSVSIEPLHKDVTKSIYKSENNPRNEEIGGGGRGNKKNKNSNNLGEPNKRKVEKASLLTKKITTTTSDGKKGVPPIPVLTYLCKYVRTKYYNTLSEKVALEEEVLHSFVELDDFLTNMGIVYHPTNIAMQVIKKKDVVKASILLYLLRQKIIYLSFINDKLLPDLGLNLNTVRRYLDKLEKDGLIVKVQKDDEVQFEEIKEMKILLRNHTRVGSHIHKIEFYCLSGIGGVLVGDLKKEFEAIVPDEVRERIDDVYKGVIPKEKQLAAEKLRQRVAEFKVEKEEAELKQEAREQKAERRLLELCLPFKKEIMVLSREVVTKKPSEKENFTPELHAFVAELRKREELISPLGVRKVWQIWKEEEKG